MLRLYQSNRLENLSRRLAQLLAQPVASPLQAETLVVQHPGMARWLSLQVASEAGICANVRALLPAAFVWEVFRVFLPDVPTSNRFDPRLLSWRLYEQLGELDDTALFKPLRRYLGDGDEARRWQLAERLAGLYDRYLVYRPDWILHWEAGQGAVPGDAWQAVLWRRLTTSDEPHWVALQQRLFSYTGERPAGLPSRLFLIGVPTLSPGFIQIIQWLAEWIDVHLLLLNPCEAHWADIVDARELARKELVADGAELYLELGNPLLASLGRQGRDFFAAINEFDPGSEELFDPPQESGLLSDLQRQILYLQLPQPSEREPDHSLALHVCHSPMREVELLYEQLLGFFDSLPALQASEILVMTPDIDAYAPLVEAVFSKPGDRPSIPYSLSDLGADRENRQMDAFLALLDVAGSRFGVNQILELLETPEIAARFGLDETALEQIATWIAKANIRWGRDGQSKRQLGLPPEPGNTWQAGLEQLLLGYAMPVGEDRLWQELAPLDAVEGASAPWLGGLLAFCEALFGLEAQLAGWRTIDGWCDFLIQLLERFFLRDLSPEQPLQQIRDAISELREEAETAGFGDDVPLTLVRQRLEATFARPSTHGFLGGGVNFCALAPMRSLPFRVICLIGMNEGAVPREPPRLGFDLMSRSFRFGDRSRRADDRYLFLETLISARQVLYLSYVGRDIRDNSSLPPSVLVDELRDYLILQIGEAGLERITHHHPLQPYSPAYFAPDGKLFSYSARLRKLAGLAGHGQQAERYLVPTPLTDMNEAWQRLELDQLLAFYTNPARAFAQQRLRLRLESGSALLEEREPFVLERFAGEEIEQRLITALENGESPQTLYRRLVARGLLPHGVAGRREFRLLLQEAQRLSRRLAERELGQRLPALPLEIELAGVRLAGRLQELHPQGQVSFSPGRFHPHRRLQLWIRHLLLNLLRPPGVTLSSYWLEREGEGSFRPVAQPEDRLQRLLALYREGMRTPLHFYPAVSWAYMERLNQDGDQQAALAAAQRKWLGNEFHPGDFQKPYNQVLLPVAGMLDQAFSDIAIAVLQPLFEHMETA